MQTSPLLRPFPGGSCGEGRSSRADRQNTVTQPCRNMAAIAVAGSSNPQPDVGPCDCWLLSTVSTGRAEAGRAPAGYFDT